MRSVGETLQFLVGPKITTSLLFLWKFRKFEVDQAFSSVRQSNIVFSEKDNCAATTCRSTVSVTCNGVEMQCYILLNLTLSILGKSHVMGLEGDSFEGLQWNSCQTRPESLRYHTGPARRSEYCGQQYLRQLLVKKSWVSWVCS